MSFISGLSLEELKQADGSETLHVALASLYFVAGFTLIFTLLGASASALGGLLAANRLLLSRVAGVLIIVFGLSMIGLFRLPMFQGGGLQGKIKHRGPFGTVLLGMAFAIAWTPCVGPILTSILVYAGSTGTVANGMMLLIVYSLGLGIPFIVSGLLFNRFLSAFSWVKTRYGLITVISGVLLIAMGILLVTNQIVYVNSWLRTLGLSSGWTWTNI